MNFNGLNFDNQIIKPQYEGMLLRASMTDGILAGCGMTLSNDVLTIQRGALIAAGRVFALDGSQTVTLTGSQRYARVLATVDTSRTASASEFLQAFTEVQTAASTSGFSALTTNDVNTSIGKYQMVLAVIDRTNQAILSTAPASTSKLADGAVGRAKFANDALYSPVEMINTSSYNLSASDCGKYKCPSFDLRDGTNSINLTQAISQSMPAGAELAIVRLYDNNDLSIVTSGIRVVGIGINQASNRTFVVKKKGGIVALKRMTSNTANGDIWFITGNVEVSAT